jgi:predicted amidohydrolase
MNVVVVEPALALDPDADNLGSIRAELERASVHIEPSDLLILPERFDLRPERAAYERDVSDLARERRCWVVGGSHRELTGDAYVNSGVIAAPDGAIHGTYDKLRPYAIERTWVSPGSRYGEFEIDGRNVLVLICADFWFVDLLLRCTRPPDLIAVPALSVTRESAPFYSRALWQNLAIARAYEFGTYVAISDWSHASRLPAQAAAGVSGFADPTTRDPAALFRATRAGAASFRVDFTALDAFRRDRRDRGFYWQT